MKVFNEEKTALLQEFDLSKGKLQKEFDSNFREWIFVYIPYTSIELAKQQAGPEIQELKEWFDSTYTYKEQKYRRLIALNKLDDDSIDAQTKLTALYEEAEVKRTRIQELEQLINN